MTLFVIGVTVSAIFLDAIALQQLHDAENEAWRRGAEVLVARSEHGIEGGSCAGLVRQPEVLAAAAIFRTDSRLEFSSRPDSPITVIETTRGVMSLARKMERASIARGAPASDGFIAAEQTAAALGLRLGESLEFKEPVGLTGPLLGTIDLSFLTAAGAGLFVVVEPGRRAFDSCVVLARPGRREQVESLLPTVLRANREGESLDVLGVLGESQRNLVSEHRRRPTRYAWMAAGIVLAVVWFLIELGRRSERGLYLALGLSRLDLAVVQAAELLLLAAAGLLASIALSSGLLAVRSIASQIALPTVTMTVAGVASILAVSVALSPIMTRGVSILDMVKDRG